MKTDKRPIETFMEREKAMNLHESFFDFDSETEIYHILYYAEYYKLLTEKKCKKLNKLLKEIKKSSWINIENFDKTK
jgi:uncharacterized protein YtpQ (UPF0354 family)